MISKNFFLKISHIKQKNYLLLSSNLNHIFSYQSLEQNKLIIKEAGYLKRGLSLKSIDNVMKESKKVLKKIVEFVDIVNKNFKNIKIIIRPHPTENPIQWKKIYWQKKNIQIIGDGNLSDWITKAKCIVHAGCTSGLEATARGKVALSITPKKILYKYHGAKIPDLVSQKIENEDQIIKKVSSIFKNNYKFDMFKHKKLIQNRIRNISNKPAYKMINETWEKLGNKNLSEKNFNLFLKVNFFF